MLSNFWVMNPALAASKSEELPFDWSVAGSWPHIHVQIWGGNSL